MILPCVDKVSDTSNSTRYFEKQGDAYLCVTNLVKDQSADHVKRIARFAVEALEAAQATLVDVEDPELGHVKLRVGFHTGPVIANVVGTRLPKFSIFGDAMNCAARMESNSAPGRIHCSQASADLLKKQDGTIPLVCRGEISIKGAFFSCLVRHGLTICSLCSR